MCTKKYFTAFTTTLVLVLLPTEVYGQVREKFDARNPSTREVAMNAEKHKVDNLGSAHVRDFLNLDAGGPALAVVRFRSPAKGVFWVTLPRMHDPVPRRILSVTCLGKSKVEGQPVGEDGRAWIFSGCSGKTPPFRFEFDDAEAISIKLDNPPGRASKGTVGLILWDWKGKMKAFGKTDWGDPVALTDVDERLPPIG